MDPKDPDEIESEEEEYPVQSVNVEVPAATIGVEPGEVT